MDQIIMDCGVWKFQGNSPPTCVDKPSKEAKEHQRICKEKGFETTEKPKPKDKSKKKTTK